MKLSWDNTGERLYETGVDHGVLYKFDSVQNKYANGVAWNGLTSISENPSGAEETKLYADNIKYMSLYSAEEFGATVEAYTYPKEFEECDGSAELMDGVTIGQQTRKPFGLSYRTKIGNDTDGQDHGYKLHLIYGAMCSPSSKAYNTVNDSPEAITFSWELTTTPVNVPQYKATASLVIDSTKFVSDEAKARLTALETVLYGTDSTPGTPAVYEEDTAAAFVANKTYYTEAGGVYTVFDQFEATSDVSFQVDKDYYERSGEEGNYTYTLTADTVMDAGKTYYTIKVKGADTYYTLKTPAVPATEATDPTLPLPAEVINILQGNNG